MGHQTLKPPLLIDAELINYNIARIILMDIPSFYKDHINKDIFLCDHIAPNFGNKHMICYCNYKKEENNCKGCKKKHLCMDCKTAKKCLECH